MDETAPVPPLRSWNTPGRSSPELVCPSEFDSLRRCDYAPRGRCAMQKLWSSDQYDPVKYALVVGLIFVVVVGTIRLLLAF